MADSISHLTKTSSSSRFARELLEQSPAELLGVSPAAAAELAKVGIETIFDLASSSLFAIARQIASSADTSMASSAVPGDAIDTDARAIEPEQLALKPLEILRAIGPASAQSLSATLGITNIREFALWPPYEAARTILSRAYGFGETAPDPEAPAELVPGSRPYPTERVQYEILVLDDLDGAEPGVPETKVLKTASASKMRGSIKGQAAALHSTGTPLESAGQLDMSMAANATAGFTRPAFGAILTYTQTWFPEGLALGQLLHSLALAPGESTRVAMVDWSRRTSASTREDLSERDALTAGMERSRSIGEIVNAVANEAQQGFSESFGIGASTSVGTASGGAGSADLTSVVGLPLKVAGGSGESTGMGIGGGYARSSSWTTGQRNLSANMAQNILDRTQQASTMSRNRRATVVREVSQTESERISTRTVTNYNHMHALSIEYFEVVQLYRVMVDLTRVSAALFVPMKLIDFNAPNVVSRYKQVIAAAGLTPQVRALMLAEPDTLLISSPTKTGNWVGSDVQWVGRMFGEPVGDETGYALAFPFNFYPMFLTFEEDAPFESFQLEFSNGTVASIPVTTTSNQQFGHAAVLVDTYGQTTSKASAFWDVVSIRAKKRAASATWAGPVTIFLRLGALQRDGFPKPQNGTTDSILRVSLDVPAGTSEVTVFEMARTVSGRALRQHLMDNQLYYSQRVWMSVDSTIVAQLLSGYTFGGRPVLSDVDPLPLTVAGNFLVFRRHEPVDPAAQSQWSQWLTKQQITPGERKTDLIPLPSGGVFAEAVLGRFNSAEKLDITRFWNWQDSPIPITPPEIAAIQAGSRAQQEDLLPGQMQPSTLRIELPPELPDPESMAAALQAIQNGAMFRDMSGLNATIGLAQSAMGRAFDAARDAANQAGENMKTAADIYKSAFGGQGAGAAGGPMQQPSSRPAMRNPSEAGALINHGQDLDGRDNGGANGAPSGLPMGAGQNFAGSSPPWGAEGAAFEAALGGSGGTIVPVGGPAPSPGAGALAAVGEIAVETAKGVIKEGLGSPDVTITGFENASCLLAQVPDAARYVDGPYDGFLELVFWDLGKSAVLDGLDGRIRITWKNCVLSNTTGLNLPQRTIRRLIALDCKREIAVSSAELTSGKAIAKASVSLELLAGNLPSQKVLDAVGTPLNSEAVPRLQIKINVSRTALAGGASLGPSLRILPLRNYATGGASHIVLSDDDNGGIRWQSITRDTI